MSKDYPKCVVTTWVYDNRFLLDAWYYEVRYPDNIEMSFEEITAILEKVQEFLLVNGIYKEVT